MNDDTLKSTVAALLAPRKGILAADESTKTIGKRFAALGIASTEETRRAYRALLFTTPGLEEHISGCILFDETIHQKIAGKPVASALERKGIITGIKVDHGPIALPGSAGETFTVGIEGLRERLSEYRNMGARFTKWRAVFAMGKNLPTPACIDANACALALFASLSQEAGLVPLVEPEVLMDGSHSLEECGTSMRKVLGAVFSRLDTYHVSPQHMILKTAMVLPGKDFPGMVSDSEVAEATLSCLNDSVPKSVPGIVFLSGGQEEIPATQHLNAICSAGASPWTLSFSFGRALQNRAMRVWAGSAGNVVAAHAALQHRALCNGLALEGRYNEQAEDPATQALVHAHA
jgi:fructose-bisphosphate aldolase class I